MPFVEILILLALRPNTSVAGKDLIPLIEARYLPNDISPCSLQSLFIFSKRCQHEDGQEDKNRPTNQEENPGEEPANQVSENTQSSHEK